MKLTEHLHETFSKQEFFGLSNVGLVRENNEDFWCAVPELHLFVLADGLGGRNSGEIAAKQSTEILTSLIKEDPLFLDPNSSEKEIVVKLTSILIETNKKIFAMSQKASYLNGMGTTLSLILFWKDKVILGHVGDSRIYRMRNKKLELLTHDDSLVFDLLHFGLINQEEATTFPLKHIITKSIGVPEDIEPFVTILPTEPEDLYLICSDGLHGLVDDHAIADILEKNVSLEKIAHLLIHAALSQGGHDNVTVVVIKQSPQK